MENQKKVIAFKNLPRRVPMIAWIVFYLLLENLNAPTLAYWTVFALLGIHTIAILGKINDQIETDIFEDKKESTN
jgi:hypothetical protein